MELTPKEPISKKRYLELFARNPEDALRVAHELRRFEIELSWKRATYFWLFVAATFTAFFVVAAAKDLSAAEKVEFQFFIACLGMLFSLGWYLVNRGSKFWQEVWETHVALLEDLVHGPLQKTFRAEGSHASWRLLSPARFSVSKVNLVLNLVSLVAWIVLAVRSGSFYLRKEEPFDGFNLVVYLALTTIGACMLLCCGRSHDDSKSFTLNTTCVIASVGDPPPASIDPGPNPEPGSS